MPQHSLPRIAYRLVSGRSLDGVARTDATYLHPGTRALTETGRASRWAMLPGFKRQAVRLATLPVLAVTATGYVAEPGVSQIGGSALAGLLAIRGARSARTRLRTRRFRSIYIRPLARVVGPMAGIPEGTPADR